MSLTHDCQNIKTKSKKSMDAEIVEEDAVDDSSDQTWPDHVHSFSFTHCKICNGPFKDAASLVCGHNFCMSCLDNLWAINEDTITEVTNKKQQKLDAHVCPTCYSSARAYYKYIKPNTLLNTMLALNARVMPPVEDGDLVETIVKSLPQITTQSDDLDIKKTLLEIGNMSIQQSDIARLDRYITKLQQLKREAERKQTYIESELTKHNISIAVTSCDDRHLIVGQHIRDMADKVFMIGESGGLSRDCYNVVMVNTQRGQLNDSDKVRALIELPVFGIAAASCIVLVKCPASAMDVVIDELFPAWSVSFGAIVAIWHEEPIEKAAVATGVAKSHFFVGGTIGPVRMMRDEVSKGNILNVCAPADAEDDIPNTVLTKIAKLIKHYTTRCVINSATKHSQWDACQLKQQATDNK